VRAQFIAHYATAAARPFEHLAGPETDG
jgi:hypothetical protein